MPTRWERHAPWVILVLRLVAAFILCGEMAFAYFIRWAPLGFWPLSNGGEEAILFCSMYSWIVTAGPGAWSVDGWLERHTSWHPVRTLTRRLQALDEPYTRAVLRIIVGFFVVQHVVILAYMAIMGAGAWSVDRAQE